MASGINVMYAYTDLYCMRRVYSKSGSTFHSKYMVLACLLSTISTRSSMMVGRYPVFTITSLLFDHTCILQQFSISKTLEGILFIHNRNTLWHLV